MSRSCERYFKPLKNCALSIHCMYIGLKFEGLSPPPEVLNHLCEKYAERRVDGPKKLPRYSLPPRMKDKIRLHLLVLCLFLDNFTVEFSVLREDLKISASK